MPTIAEINDALGTQAIAAAEAGLLSWREGDKAGAFINPKDLTQAMVNLTKVEAAGTPVSASSDAGTDEGSIFVGFVC